MFHRSEEVCDIKNECWDFMVFVGFSENLGLFCWTDLDELMNENNKSVV